MLQRFALRLLRRTSDRFRELIFDSLAEFGAWLMSYAIDNGGDVDLWLRFTDDGEFDVKYSVTALESDGWTVEIGNIEKEDVVDVP